MKKEILNYYNDLAKDYDQSRFDNSYGQFIHAQEIHILNKYLEKKSVDNNLDIGCGTGRFLDYANHGIDISQNMLNIAQSKFPRVNLHQADGENIPFPNNHFDNAISFHLMMHLQMEQVNNIIKETHRVLKKGGQFIFDIPSAKRRNLLKYSADSWHGANKATIKEIQSLISPNWKVINYHGISFLPLHRIPKHKRAAVFPIDNFLCNTFFKEYASYLVIIIEKK